MNSIDAVMRRSRFMSDEHLVVEIDGVPLTELVGATFDPAQGMDGLISTLLPYLDKMAERRVVWARALPVVGERLRFPALMCPDDCDFTCSLVVADVEATSTAIRWHRLGLDQTGDAHRRPTQNGREVEWIRSLGPFTFERTAYERCLETFRAKLDAS